MTHILIADDEASIRTILSRAMEKKGFEVVRARTGSEALGYLKELPIDVALLDIRMPDISGLEILNHQNAFSSHPLIFVITAQDTMENAVEAMKRGAYDYVTKPFDLDELSLLVDRALETRQLRTEVKRLKQEGARSTQSLIGKSKSIQEIFKTIGKVANQDVTVLIHGESGTGKELVAKAVHYQGSRAPYPFVAVNCSAIPRELLESELFGHKKGAFTGAIRDKTGYFLEAHLGSLFLDEIADLPLSVQAKLLRVIQEREIQKVGDSKAHSINVRIVAATNRNLDEMVRKGEFREDLFFRLNVVPIYLPPLRERRSDIPLLVNYFISQYGEPTPHGIRGVSEEALEYLQKREWPGNIRELENVVRRVLVLSQGPWLEKKDFELLSQTSSGGLTPSDIEGLSLEEVIHRKLKPYFERHEEEEGADLYSRFLPSLERPLIRMILQKTKGNQLKAATILGINRNTLRKKIRELGIKEESR